MPQDWAERWRPRLGAYAAAGGFTFGVWAPGRRQVELALDPVRGPIRRRPLRPDGDGMFTATFDDVAAGDRYSYLLDGEGPYPDPASRFQPAGVHGPSAVVDASAFAWSDQAWHGVGLADAVFYELHVGTFSPEGTFDGVADRLSYLVDLGVTVVELMPIADFPGQRNWGYDGVSLFAPSRAYGTPDDLRRLVDRAHALGLAVVLDVVYNHFGPDGAYAPVFSPLYLSARHHSPWGAAVNLDGEGSAHVREFFIENALHWLHEYHFDGLRLDATHALRDDTPRHFVAELAARVRASLPQRQLLLVAEDERNLATIVRRPDDHGWGLDAVWADDFHHHVRRRVAGDADGYYVDFSGTAADIAATIRQGWFYTGQHSIHGGGPRGTSATGIPRERMIVCIQNHDQIGNRPFGGRLNHQIEPALYRAVSALLLLLPETPLLFMGQEWAASSRFLFFTDHHAGLGPLVTEGRRTEFSRFAAFADPVIRAQIPDPQAASTFEDSRLDWSERTVGVHAGTLEWYRALLRLRRARLRPDPDVDVVDVGGDGLVLRRRTTEGGTLLLVVCLADSLTVDLERWRRTSSAWAVGLTSEEPRFCDDSTSAWQPEAELGDRMNMTFRRPGAVLLETTA